MTIQEIKGLSDGDAIPSVTVTVKAVYPTKEIGGKWPKRLQNCMVADSTGEFYLTFAGKNNQQLESAIKGKKITVSCSKSKDGAPQGVKMKIEDYNGKQYPKIWVTDTARIAVVGEGDSAPASSSSPSGGGKSSAGDRTVVLADEFIKNYADVWLHTYEVMLPAFEEKGLQDLLPDRVTACLITAGYNQNYILASKKADGNQESQEDNDWKSFEYSTGKKLGELKIEGLLKICKKVLSSDKHKDKWPACKAAIQSLINSGTVEDVVGAIAASLHKKKVEKLKFIGEFCSRESIGDIDGVISCLLDDDLVDKINCSQFDESLDDDDIDL